MEEEAKKAETFSRMFFLRATRIRPNVVRLALPTFPGVRHVAAGRKQMHGESSPLKTTVQMDHVDDGPILRFDEQEVLVV
jgi:hypothetical protein